MGLKNIYGYGMPAVLAGRPAAKVMEAAGAAVDPNSYTGVLLLAAGAAALDALGPAVLVLDASGKLPLVLATGGQPLASGTLADAGVVPDGTAGEAGEPLPSVAAAAVAEGGLIGLVELLLAPALLVGLACCCLTTKCML